ncbi:MAG: hypothetical protein NC925_04615 [Candidatus Omnitrophica bacterium]|nr:hypothetical protein [Candidatus Omnitrophota bacterium]
MELNFNFNSKIYYQNCGLTSLNLLFRYYKISGIPKDLIRKNRNNSLWISDLGIIALKKGFKVNLFTYSQRIFKPEWFDLPKHRILQKLYRKEKNLLINLARKSIIEFLKLGGEIKFKILNAKTLKFYIKNKKPLLMTVSSGIIHHRSMPGGHFVVLIGYDKRNFIILNPGEREVKKEKVDIDLLLYAFYQWGAWAMTLS